MKEAEELRTSGTRLRRPSAAPRDRAPILTRLNARGIRLLQVVDAAAIFAVLMATSWVRFWLLLEPRPDRPEGWPAGPGNAYTPTEYLVSFGIISVLFVVVLYFAGLYEREPRLGFPPALPRTVKASLAAILLFVAIAYVTSGTGARTLPAPSGHLVVLFFAGSIITAANRRLAHWHRLNRDGPPRVLLVGAPDEINVARLHIEQERDRAMVVGEVSSTDELLTRVEEVGATDVVLLSGRWLDTLYPALLNRLERRGITVLQRVTAKETLFGLERAREVGGMPFVLLRSQALPVSQARFKRLLELGLLVLASPFLLLLLGGLALYQLIVVGRPILFWQERVGKDGSVFEMVKFRTMYPRAEEDGSPRLATYDDPRIIPASRWLRRTRFDELPQVWNVLKGEMSLVGPRPERPMLTAQYEELIPGYSRRNEIPPGITGLAQVHGRYDTDPEYKLGYDLQYLVNWSPVLDLEILVRTVWVVITRRI